MRKANLEVLCSRCQWQGKVKFDEENDFEDVQRFDKLKVTTHKVSMPLQKKKVSTGFLLHKQPFWGRSGPLAWLAFKRVSAVSLLRNIQVADPLGP